MGFALDLLDTTDAMAWARAFVETIDRDRHDEVPRADPHDPGFMVGWFANAMLAQERWDAADWRKADTEDGEEPAGVATMEAVMRASEPEPIVVSMCRPCGGHGLGEPGTSCTTCGGTGLLRVR